MDVKRKKIRLGDVLINNGVITQEQLGKALEQQKGSGKKLGEVLVEEGYATEEAIAGALARQMGYAMVNLQNMTVEPDILNLVPVNVLKKDVIFPFEYAPDKPNVLRVAMADPMDMY